MSEGIVHKMLKEKVRDIYNNRYNVCFEFRIFNRRADVVLFKNHNLYAIIECKNNHFKKDLFRKFEYWKSKGLNCKFMVYSVKTNQLDFLKKEFKENNISYNELNIRKDSWKKDFMKLPKETGGNVDGS